MFKAKTKTGAHADFFKEIAKIHNTFRNRNKAF